MEKIGTILATPRVSNDYVDERDIKDLAGEIKAIADQGEFRGSMEVIEANHRIGQAILTHKAYKKGKHGAGTLVKQLAKETNKSQQHLYQCMMFYEKYPELSNALETLKPEKINLAWRDIVNSLSGKEEEQEKCDHPKAEQYKITYEICRCCGNKTKIN